MKLITFIFAASLAAASSADFIRIGEFEGQFSQKYEGLNFLGNPYSSAFAFAVITGENAIRTFDNAHITEAYPLQNTGSFETTFGYARTGSSLSVRTWNSLIRWQPNGGGPDRTLRFGGWFMLNGQTLDITFKGPSGVPLGSDSISGSSNLQYQWFGWEAQNENFQWAELQHRGPRNQFSNFHIDDSTHDVVPEPASLLALAAGAGTLLRKRRK